MARKGSSRPAYSVNRGIPPSYFLSRVWCVVRTSLACVDASRVGDAV